MLVCVDTLGLARVSFCIALNAGGAPGARIDLQSHSSDQSCRSAQAIAPVPRAYSNSIRAAACCMSSTRKLARIAAPVACALYVTYVAIDRGYYHIERRKELDAATARAKAEAKRRVEADEQR